MKRLGGPGEIRTHDLFHAMEAMRFKPIRCKSMKMRGGKVAHLWPTGPREKIEVPMW